MGSKKIFHGPVADYEPYVLVSLPMQSAGSSMPQFDKSLSGLDQCLLKGHDQVGS